MMAKWMMKILMINHQKRRLDLKNLKEKMKNNNKLHQQKKVKNLLKGKQEALKELKIQIFLLKKSQKLKLNNKKLKNKLKK